MLRHKPRHPKRDTLTKPGARPVKPGYHLVPGKPATPGVRNKRATPFLTPDQGLDVWRQEQDWQGQVNDATDAYAQLGVDSELKKQQIAQQRDLAVRAVNEQMAARGLFRSSLRDTGLIDTEKAAAQQRTAVDGLLITARGRLDALRAGITQAKEPFYKLINDMKIDNAEDINKDLPEYSTDPTAATPGRVVKNKPGAAKKPGHGKHPGHGKKHHRPAHRPVRKLLAHRTPRRIPPGSGGRISTEPVPSGRR